MRPPPPPPPPPRPAQRGASGPPDVAAAQDAAKAKRPSPPPGAGITPKISGRQPQSQATSPARPAGRGARRVWWVAAAVGVFLAVALAAWTAHRVASRPGVAKREVTLSSPQAELEVRKEPKSLGATKGVYSLRTQPYREQWIGTRGGTPESERAVAAGLEWLARHQSEEGLWCTKCLELRGSNPHAQCEEGGPCTGPGSDVDMAHTGLALLALQAGGHYDFNGQEYSENVRRGLKWIVENQRPDGGLVGPAVRWREYIDRQVARSPYPREMAESVWRNCRDQFYMYEHGIATFALAEACAVAIASNREPDPRCLAVAEAAVRFIEQNQHDDGGWRYTPDKSLPSDTSVSGWQVLALKTAIEAGMKVDEDCIARAVAFFKTCEAGWDGRTNYKATFTKKTLESRMPEMERQFKEMLEMNLPEDQKRYFERMLKRLREGPDALGDALAEGRKEGMSKLLEPFPKENRGRYSADMARKLAALEGSIERNLGEGTEATTGVGMLVHEFLLRQPESPLVQQGARYLVRYAEDTWAGLTRADMKGAFEPMPDLLEVDPMGLEQAATISNIDYYSWYNCSLALSHVGGEPWNRWNAIVRDLLADLQETEGCAKGSWSPNSRFGLIGGRIYSTAMAVLTLEVYYRFAKE